MKSYILALCLVAAVVCSPIIPYTGLRIAMKKPELSKYLINVYTSLAHNLNEVKWDDVTQGGFFSMKVTNIKCSGNYDSKSSTLKSMTVTEKKIETIHSGQGFLVDFEFDYAYGLFGLNFMSGKGTATYHSSSTTLKQEFKETEVKSDLKSTFEITILLGSIAIQNSLTIRTQNYFNIPGLIFENKYLLIFS